MKASSYNPPSASSPLQLPYIPEDSPLPTSPPTVPRSPPRRHTRSSSGSHSPLLKNLWKPNGQLPDFGGLPTFTHPTQDAPGPAVGLGIQDGFARSEKPRRSLSSPFPLSLVSGSLPTDQLPLFHPSSGKNRFAFPLEKDRPYHPSSPRARAEALNATMVVGRLTRVLGVCVLLFVVAVASKVGGEVLMALSEGWEGGEGW